MLSLLNVAGINDAVFWILVAQGVLLIIEIAALAVLFLMLWGKDRTKESRQLVGITLDTSIVRREFKVGEEFDPAGLGILANYNEAPNNVPVEDFSVATQEELRAGRSTNEIGDCIVIAPEMDKPGRKTVTVKYKDMKAVYAIVVGEESAVEASAPVEEESASVVAPVAAAEPEKKERKLLSLTLDTGVVPREFYVGDEFYCEGLIVMAHYDEAPYVEEVRRYRIAIPDMSEEGKVAVRVYVGDVYASYAITILPVPEEKPEEEVVVVEEEPAPERVLVGISLDTANVQREFTVGDEFNSNGLIVTANYNVEPYSEQVTGYEVSAPELTEAGKNVVTVTFNGESAVYAISVAAPAIEEPEVNYEDLETAEKEPIIIEEESAEFRLRYNRSFTARLIQSDDDLKQWYTEIKNELLSYKKAKARMSWKRENYRLGREMFAKFGFRGKTLCLFLPLNAIEFEGTKYKLEDVSDNASNMDTPSMLRIKNARRVKYAIELIQLVAANFAAPRIEREQEDFYLPYEGVVQLINKGLIKRNVKSAEKEAFFVAVAEPSQEAEEIAPGVFVKPQTADEEEVAAADATAEEPAAFVDEPVPADEVPEDGE